MYWARNYARLETASMEYRNDLRELLWLHLKHLPQSRRCCSLNSFSFFYDCMRWPDLRKWQIRKCDKHEILYVRIKFEIS